MTIYSRIERYFCKYILAILCQPSKLKDLEEIWREIWRWKWFFDLSFFTRHLNFV